jgi:hypothetical protein
MATYTTTLALRKPAGTDYVSRVLDINNNLDSVDALFHATTGHKHTGAGTHGPVVTLTESQIVYDAVEAATLDTLSGASMLINNLNRIRYYLTQISGQALGTVSVSLNAHVINTSSAHTVSGVLTVATAHAAGTNPATNGTFRGPNNTLTLVARNAANSADLELIWLSLADVVIVGNTTSTKVQVRTALQVDGAYISVGPLNVSTTGAFRMQNNTSVVQRNNANNADLQVVGLDTADALVLRGQRSLFQYPASSAVDWNNGDSQTFAISSNTTFTFANPVTGRFYTLKITQDGTGSRTYTWPAAVKWPNGVAPTASGANKVDMMTFYYDGTNYYGSAVVNY